MFLVSNLARGLWSYINRYLQSILWWNNPGDIYIYMVQRWSAPPTNGYGWTVSSGSSGPPHVACGGGGVVVAMYACMHVCIYVGVSENSVPLNPMVFMIIIPIKWLFHWEYTQHFQTNPCMYVRHRHKSPASRPRPTAGRLRFRWRYRRRPLAPGAPQGHTTGICADKKRRFRPQLWPFIGYNWL